MKSDEHAQTADVQDASACNDNGDLPEKRVKTEPSSAVVKSEPYESDGNECDSPLPSHDPAVQPSTDEGCYQAQEEDDRNQLRTRLTEMEALVAASEAQISASQKSEKEAKDTVEVEVTKNRMLSEYIEKLEARIRAHTEGNPQQSCKAVHKADPLTQVDTDSEEHRKLKAVGTQQGQNIKCLPQKTVGEDRKTVIIKWPRTYATIDTQTDGVHCDSAAVQTDAIEQPHVAVSDSSIQTETAPAPSPNLQDAAAQTGRVANVDVQTTTVTTFLDASNQTTLAKRAEASAQTDAKVQDYDGLLAKARRHIVHLLQANLDAKKEVMRGSHQLVIANQKNDKLLSKIYRLKNKLSAAKTDVRDLGAKRDHFEMELFAVDLRLTEANDTISQMTGDLENAYESNEELEELLDARIMEIGMLQENHATKVEVLQKAVRDKSLELAALNEILNDVALEKDQTLTEMSVQVRQKEAELERLSSRLADVAWDRDQCREKWRHEVEQLERELQRMRSELMTRSHEAARDSGQSWRRAAPETLPPRADVNPSRIPRYLRHDGTDEYECEYVHDTQHTFFR